jgi:5-methyltetrahydropteroyltriglutamate--homocysteine methyltransferase
MLRLLIDEQAWRVPDRTALDATIQRAGAEVMQQQAAIGLDVINDGEQGRVNYTVYIKDRLSGSVPRRGLSLLVVRIGQREESRSCR